MRVLSAVITSRWQRKKISKQPNTKHSENLSPFLGDGAELVQEELQKAKICDSPNT